MSEIETKRVHISGLDPAKCSVQDLHSRFESFQLQVSDVHNWPPGKDGVDKVQNWCFLTLKGDAAKIKRATEVLNGTIWKGEKLRIGLAKKEKGRGEVALEKETKAVDEADKPKRKKRKTKGVESLKIDQPISIKDVEEGEWGWKKTPAGHLLRPLHMRPSHPLPVPSARPIVEAEETEKKMRKRKAKGSKPLKRARKVVVDPSRYGAVHLAGPILDDGSESLPTGCAWTCQDIDDSGIKWSLIDAQGQVIKQELVKKLKEKALPEAISEAESDYSSDDDSSMDEVAAAIDNAGSEMSSSDEEEKYDSPISKVAEKSKTIELPFLDEGEESDFSEGYQEIHSGVNALPKDWQEEKASHLELLKSMFGEEEVSLEIQAPAQVHSNDADESEEEEIEAATTKVNVPIPTLSAGAQKRAALLGAFTNGQPKSKAFEPLVRFDPGLEAAAEEGSDVDVIENNDAQEVVRAEKETAAPVEVSRDDLVQMSSLKDMFRPKEDSTGFTLLGDLDLDLEAEDEEEEAPDLHVAPVQQIAPAYQPVQRVASIKSAHAKLPFIFPTFDTKDKSWLSILQKDKSVTPFCKDKTDEEIQAQWKERKGQLTQDYKRRHREALKKKKRKYTGSRAAGTSMPLRS